MRISKFVPLLTVFTLLNIKAICAFAGEWNFERRQDPMSDVIESTVSVAGISNVPERSGKFLMTCSNSRITAMKLETNFPLDTFIGPASLGIRYSYRVGGNPVESSQVFFKGGTFIPNLTELDLLGLPNDPATGFLALIGMNQTRNAISRGLLLENADLRIRVARVGAEEVTFRFPKLSSSELENLDRSCPSIRAEASENSNKSVTKADNVKPVPEPKKEGPVEVMKVEKPSPSKQLVNPVKKEKPPANFNVESGEGKDWKQSVDKKVLHYVTYKPKDNAISLQSVFDVELTESGFIIGVKLNKSSGDKDWDQAVEQAIWASSSWPLPQKQKLKSPVTVTFASGS